MGEQYDNWRRTISTLHDHRLDPETSTSISKLLAYQGFAQGPTPVSILLVQRICSKDFRVGDDNFCIRQKDASLDCGIVSILVSARKDAIKTEQT